MKIIIIGTENSPSASVAKGLQKANDDLQIAPVFTTKLSMKGKTCDGTYYMSNEETELSYKNNAFMWVRTCDSYSTGVIMSDMYSSSLFVMDFGDFNNISNPVLNEVTKDDECVLVVLDVSGYKKSKDELREAEAAFERIYAHPYLYFLDEKPQDIIDCILNYIGSTPDERKNIEESLNN